LTVSLANERGEFVGAALLNTLLVLAYFLIGSAVIVFLFWWALKRLGPPK
jgi:hypothetical protein